MNGRQKAKYQDRNVMIRVSEMLVIENLQGFLLLVFQLQFILVHIKGEYI